LEVIIAMAIFAFIGSAMVTMALGGLEGLEQGGEYTQAEALAQEGVEAIRAVRDKDWNDLNCSLCAVEVIGNQWTISASASQEIGQYTRIITISDVYRDSGDNIVAPTTPGATIDTDSKKINSTIEWATRPGFTKAIERICYLTNWAGMTFEIICDWPLIELAGSLDAVGDQDGLKVQYQDNYAYLIRDDGSPDFAIIDVTDTSSPSFVGSLALSGIPSNIAVSGNYAFISSSANKLELQVIDISNKVSPSLIGIYNASGNANASGIYYNNSTVYLIRDSSRSDEFLIIDVSIPSFPDLIGSLDLGIGANEVIVLGDYAYIATDSDSQELQVVDISTPSLPSIVGSYDASDSSNGMTITGFDDVILLGRDNGDVYLINISIPSSPSYISDYSAQDVVNDLALGTSNEEIFIASNYSNGEIQVVDISTLDSPSLISSYDATSYLRGVAISDRDCVIYTASEENSSELIILVPGVLDTIPPATIIDLALSSPGISSIDLSWTAPGDDDDSGTASSYDVRYSTSLIDDGNWSLAVQAIGEPVPLIAGLSESMTVSGLDSNTTYYFAIKTSDEIPNTSGLSNVPNLATLEGEATIFYETFPGGDGAWNGSSDTVQDEPGWEVYQGLGDINDIQVSNEDSGSSSSDGNHLTFEDCDHGFQNPEIYDIAYVPVDFSNYTDISIEYYWQSDDVDAGEGLRVAYSVDSTDGIDGTWIQIAEYINPSDDIWTKETYILPNGDAVSGFMLRFSSKSSAPNEHMYVDDIKIIGTSK